MILENDVSKNVCLRNELIVSRIKTKFNSRLKHIISLLVANSNSSISGGLSLSQSLTKSCHTSTCAYASMTLNSLYLCMHIRNLRFFDLVFSYFDFSLPQRLRLLSTGLARAAMGLPAVLSELPVRLLTLTLALL